jgi:hypothetical protein
MTTPNDALPPDPFDVPPSVPSLSFKDAPIGTTYTGRVVRLPSLIQSRDFEDSSLKFWPDGNPMMTAVFHITLANGEERSVWCPKPSSMFAAVTEAQNANKQRMLLGDTVTITFTGEVANATNPRLNPAKQYAVKIVPADPFAGQQLPPASNGHVAAAAAPAVSAPAPAPAPAQPMLVAQDTTGALEVLGQIRGLLALGLSDAQIGAVIPQATADVIDTVRSIPV